MLKRIFDIILSFTGLLFLIPVFLIISLLIILESGGGVFFLQERIGKNQKPFKLFKFRTMYPDSHKKGLITVGGRDKRVTPTGYWLRKFKLDELPQLINVLIGDMSLVGPRPEVKRYTDMYTEEQKKVLSVKPGITDYASIEYIDENELLAKSENPEKTYTEEVMPAKLRINIRYIEEQSFLTDLKIILKTIREVIG